VFKSNSFQLLTLPISFPFKLTLDFFKCLVRLTTQCIHWYALYYGALSLSLFDSVLIAGCWKYLLSPATPSVPAAACRAITSLIWNDRIFVQVFKVGLKFRPNGGYPLPHHPLVVGSKVSLVLLPVFVGGDFPWFGLHLLPFGKPYWPLNVNAICLLQVQQKSL